MPATRSTVIGSSRSRRVATCASIRCCRTSSVIVSASASLKPMPPSDTSSNDRTGDTVVAVDRLAEVMQQCSDQQQVRTPYVAHHLRRLDTGLQQVPVDGEAVDRRLRRPEPHRVPLGQDPRDVAGLVQRLPDLKQSGARTEQRTQQPPRLGRPGLRQSRSSARQPSTDSRRQTRAHDPQQPPQHADPAPASRSGRASGISTTSPSCCPTPSSSASSSGPPVR